MFPGKRAERVGDQILKEIAVILLESIQDPRILGTTVTAIRLSNDLKAARVYYSVMGEGSQIGRAQTGLDSAKGFIKRQIGRRLALRYVPDISFIYDPSLEIGSRMDRLLAEIGKEEDK